ncbi:TetR family transcriptional regulator [Actinophytocola xinjiangensis]|uniref:TetR family transcriptional regulator n=1 Tax=Actinophytocola xinjiangensis TaxID=485602 RepID=A0A7Z0WSH9_9PSEU|nr:TetR/AcrR family transcriptional regulator [Actinophytocola xinjiangensis]OLF12126.1 TetR family transcriptional regulator [Actinophytocola xinjiangensis]
MDGRAARWAGQRERRRREFVEAALRAIAQHGAEVTTEQIAEAAGVARTQVYKHFTGADDLRRSISDQAVELINATLAPLWNLQGTPMEMIRSAVGSHVAFLADHYNLYWYLSVRGSQGAITDVKTAVARHLTLLFEFYLSAFGIDKRVAEPLGFGVVGLVDLSTIRWLENANEMDQSELADLLSTWVWRIVDDVLRSHQVVLSPDVPLTAAGLTFTGESGEN